MPGQRMCFKSFFPFYGGNIDHQTGQPTAGPGYRGGKLDVTGFTTARQNLADRGKGMDLDHGMRPAFIRVRSASL